MSSLKLKKIQLGKSLTPGLNFTIMTPDVPDGTLEIRRGVEAEPGAIAAKISDLGVLSSDKMNTQSFQIGNSATAANNFTLQTDGAGALEIRRGNQDAPGALVLKVNANGSVVSSVAPAFSAHTMAAQTIPATVNTVVQLEVEEYDLGACFANSKFTPNIPGLYMIGGGTAWTPSTSGSAGNYINKNGAIYRDGTFGPMTHPTEGLKNQVSSLVYFNGTTDYVELSCYQSSGAALGLLTSIARFNYFWGYLVRAD